MKKIETLFIGGVIGIALVGAVVGVLRNHDTTTRGGVYSANAGKFGNFLAAQHAVYVNDFENAARFAAGIDDVDLPVVQNTKMLADFLSGRMPDAVILLEPEKTVPARMVYDAYLVTNDMWDELYKRHKSDDSAITAPLRIWASVAAGHADDAIKFVEKLPTNDSWKAFVRGQIRAEQGDPTAAAAEFAKVGADFMNINDYQYIMAFYRANDMADAAAALRDDFTGRPGGMFMLDMDAAPDWSRYAGYKNALGFSMVQNVSHTQMLMYSDLAILMLRFAQITAPGMDVSDDAINYYLGQYFFNNSGDYATYFGRVSNKSPFYPFTILRVAEQGGDIDTIRRVVRAYPLFVPAVNAIVAHHVKNGERRAALRVVNRALGDKRLSDASHAFFLKLRANIHYVFGDYDAAASDLHAAADILVADMDIVMLQAKIWAAQQRDIESAYEYAMTLVRGAPADVAVWDVLGRVVAVREGVDAALDVIARVADVSSTCSALFDQLGDLYAQKGDAARARTAYLRAIDLSDDGMVVISNIKKKLRKLK